MMKELRKLNTIQIIGIILMIIGFFHIFPDNDVWYHDVLQMSFAIGNLCLWIPFLLKKKLFINP